MFWRYTVLDVDTKVSLFIQREEILVMQSYENLLLAASAIFAKPSDSNSANQITSISDFNRAMGI